MPLSVVRAFVPIAKSPSCLKGVAQPTLLYQTAHRIFSQRAFVFSNDLLKVWYYPSYHFLALCQKSVPAITIKTYAKSSVDRRKNRVKLKQLFFEEYLKSKNSSLDGYYVYQLSGTISLRDIKPGILEKSVEDSFKGVIRQVTGNKNSNWVNEVNNKVHVGILNKQLALANFPIKFFITPDLRPKK